MKYTQEDKDWFLSKFSSVISILKFLNTYHNKNLQADVKLTDLWVNYMQKGKFNLSHIHNQQLSFVIYVQVEKLIEENKNYQGTDTSGLGIKFINDVNSNMLNIVRCNNFPKEKECYIFRSH